MIDGKTLDQAVARPSGRLAVLARWLEELDDLEFKSLAARAAGLTRRHFGRTMRLFAPLYLSNECINSCAYCGFSRENEILRVTLEVREVLKEAGHLMSEGFRSLLLVAGEHPKFVSGIYLQSCLSELRRMVPSLAIEVAPMEIADYRRMVEAGAEGLVLYQETYDPEIYSTLHLAGPKKDFAWRLMGPERGYAGGFRRIGVGALLGLAPWRSEMMRLGAHLDWLLRNCWRAHFTVSFPRLRPAAGSFAPRYPVSDRDLVQMVCAFRVAFPTVGIVLSTREPSALRDVLARVGVTLMSAGSHTEPGGYTGQGTGKLHHTVRGLQIVAEGESADAQFAVSDRRSASEVAAKLREMGLEPVWKDWDQAIMGEAA